LTAAKLLLDQLKNFGIFLNEAALSVEESLLKSLAKGLLSKVSFVLLQELLLEICNLSPQNPTF